MGDSTGNGTLSIDGQTADRLSAASGEVSAKHGGARVGAGRKPSGGGSPNRGGKVVERAAPTDSAEVETPVSAEDIKFVSESIQTFFALIDEMVCGKISRSMDQIAQGDARVLARRDDLLATIKITPKELDLVGRSGAALAAKYSIISRFAPECAMVGVAVTYGMRASSGMKEVGKLAAVVAQLRHKHGDSENTPDNAGSPQPN